MTKVVEDNLPESLKWEIDLFTVPECMPLIKKHFKLERIEEWDYDWAEKAMIQESSPAFNISLNANVSPIPLKYTQKRLERLKKTMLQYPPQAPKAK